MKFLLTLLCFLSFVHLGLADDLETELESLDDNLAPIDVDELNEQDQDELTSLSAGFDLEEQLELEEHFVQQDQEQFPTESPIEEEVDLEMIDYLNVDKPRHYGGRVSKPRLKRTTPRLKVATFRALLRKGAKLLHLKTGKWYQTRRNTYVLTRHNTKAKNETYIYND